MSLAKHQPIALEGAISTDTAQIDFKIGLVTTAGGKFNSVQKKIDYKDGRAVKDPKHSLNVTSGKFVDRTVTGMAGLAELIGSLSSTQALTLGICGHDQTQQLVTAKKLKEETGDYEIEGEERKNVIARTKECLNFSEVGAFFLLLDVDAEPGKPAMTAKDLLSLLTSIAPEFATVGSVTTKSSSSHIYHKSTDECLNGEGNFHVFIPVSGDVSRFAETLKNKFWAAEEGFYKLATPNKQTGVSAILERFPIDMCVLARERLVYEAGAKLPKELEQRRGKPIAVEGTILDLDAIVASPEEIARAKINREAARAEIVATRLEQAIVNICESEPSVTREAAVTRATRLIEDVERGVLDRDHVLYLEDGTEITAGILEKSHLWVKLRDPQEPNYDGGRYCAQVIPMKGGKIGINSFAHGECKYTIAPLTTDEPITAETAESWDLTDVPDGEIGSKTMAAMRAVKRVVGKNLRLNELTNLIEFFGKPLDPNTYKLFVAKLVDIDRPEGDCTMILSAIARKNAYHPVKIWLENLHQTHGESTIDQLDSPASRYLNTGNALYDTMLRLQLIAAVKRVYEPGCKFDHAVILQGPQGIGKSTFWNTLASDVWFDDNLGADVENKDELMKLHRTWIEEWGEIDRITGKKEMGVVKSFLSRRVDTFRAPYERTAVEHPRRGVIVGSVNPSEFLKDDENRRLWVIPVTQRIDIEAVKRDRDHIWAAAVALYKSGTQIWLSSEDEQQLRESNTQFAVLDAWEDTIDAWVNSPANTIVKPGEKVEWVCIEDVLTTCLGISDVARHTPFDRTRVQNVLRRSGFSPCKNTVRLPGYAKPKRAWFRQITVQIPITPQTPEPRQIAHTPIVVPSQNPDLGTWVDDDPDIVEFEYAYDPDVIEMDDRQLAVGRVAA